mmetsp:Transcript_7544/g.10228  ORF Transcript_7544/g.10228 Transcript_7544/m.10228 type:complete len:236 (+) Transcript_7544:300-1007(+)
MRNRGLRRNVERKRKRCKHRKRLTELGRQHIIRNIKNLGIKKTSIVVHRLKQKTVRKGLNAKFLQQRRLRRRHLFACGNQRRIVDHLDLSPCNLGSNLKGLEERGLTGITACGTFGHDDWTGGNGTHTGRRRTHIRLQHFANLAQIAVRKDETNIALALGGEGTDRTSRILLAVLPDALAHHGVLSHENFGFAAETAAGVLKLGGSHVVYLDDEAFLVCTEEFLHAYEVLCFTFC